MTVKAAIGVLAEAFRESKFFRQTYTANIACLLYDNQRTPATRENLKSAEGAQKMAKRILKLIFE